MLLDLLKVEHQLVQDKINQYDEDRARLKGWMITISAGLTALSVTAGQWPLLLLVPLATPSCSLWPNSRSSMSRKMWLLGVPNWRICLGHSYTRELCLSTLTTSSGWPRFSGRRAAPMVQSETLGIL